MLTSVKLTVFFEEPFWVGVFEVEEGEYKVSKVTFGAEPKESDIYQFILKNYYKMNFFKEDFYETRNLKNNINPKRQQRNIKRQLKNKEIGTKAQIAIKKQHEESKIQNKKNNKEKKEAEERRKFQLKKRKRKEKHKGH
ncbi:hypothetical protein CM240_2962 [Clostridium bornimense]|uniref:DUF2992 family protein n=1 Tax=Clostridium bornimense TaxID=1216932 RepID=W6S2F1_9CLOT|nr:YjdF family protein [Clostridium bornimense]CDM70079.1 hypothetical protein CM240_2962 [Clostridium bornimense]